MQLDGTLEVAARGLQLTVLQVHHPKVAERARIIWIDFQGHGNQSFRLLESTLLKGYDTEQMRSIKLPGCLRQDLLVDLGSFVHSACLMETNGLGKQVAGTWLRWTHSKNIQVAFCLDPYSIMVIKS